MKLDVLDTRRSVPSRQLGEPAPTGAELDRLLSAAIRVPDHGHLVPWRLLLVRGDARAKLGQSIAAIHAANDPDVPPSVLAKDRDRFNCAPLIVVVIARIDGKNPKVPAQEQVLSAGCVSYNLLLGAQQLGYGAQWLTGWAAYDREVAALLGLAADECIVGFVHIGTAPLEIPERLRPALGDVVSQWHGG